MKKIISVTLWNLFVNTLGKSWLISNKLRFVLYKIAGMRTSSGNIRSGCVFRGKSVFIEGGYL